MVHGISDDVNYLWSLAVWALAFNLGDNCIQMFHFGGKSTHKRSEILFNGNIPAQLNIINIGIPMRPFTVNAVCLVSNRNATSSFHPTKYDAN